MMKSIFTKSTQESVIINKSDIESYHGTDYPNSNGTVIYFKDGSSIRVNESFNEVDSAFNL